MNKGIVTIICAAVLYACSSPLESPTVTRSFSTPASSGDVIRFCRKAAEKSENLEYHVFGQSANGTDLVAVRATGKPGEAHRLKILLFALQHGNEQSGKEAALLLIRDIALGKLDHYLHNLELWIVPNLNPDGGDLNKRRNAHDTDLNRDHIVQQAPETRALHALFREQMPHVTIDVHEYQPFRESWAEFGGYKNFDVQVGIPTNLNVDENIRQFALENALPAIEKHLNHMGYSFHNYIVGPVPTQGPTRHSTVDFDDGRQSFAILNTLSFIYEGINGPDGFVENLERRTYGQYHAMIGLLDFLHAHAVTTMQMVNTARQQLRSAKPGEKVAIRMDHFPDNNSLRLPLTSSHTGLDTLVIVENFHPIVKPQLEVPRPKAYLIPQKDSLLMQFLKLHHIEYQYLEDLSPYRVWGYYIDDITIREDEGLENRYPAVRRQELTHNLRLEKYVWVSTQQLHSNFLVSLFEPQSMLGLARRDGFEYLLNAKERFPVLRVE